MDDLTQAGDYTGPHPVIDQGVTKRRVLFLLPGHTGRDMFDRPDQLSGMHGIMSPPWVFAEQPDGSLAVQPSIACGRPPYWHGYLDAGNVWRAV